MRRIIIIDTKRMQYETGLDDIALRAAFWFPVPAGAESPLGTVPGITRVASVTEIELVALQEGTVVEELYEIMFPLDATGVQIRSTLVAAYQAHKLKQSPRPNPTRLNGASFDGSTWTLAETP